jgi:hypothetical protein
LQHVYSTPLRRNLALCFLLRSEAHGSGLLCPENALVCCLLLPQKWGEFGRLAYSSCFMKVAESWAFGMLVLFAGAQSCLNPAKNIPACSCPRAQRLLP